MMVHISFYEFWLVFYKAGSGSLKMKRIRIRNTELMIGYSECGGGAAGVLADEGSPGGEPQERGLGHLRVSPRLGPALHLLRDPARRIMLRQLRGTGITISLF